MPKFKVRGIRTEEVRYVMEPIIIEAETEQDAEDIAYDMDIEWRKAKNTNSDTDFYIEEIPE